MNQSLELLGWDSDFFNFNVGRIVGDIKEEEDLRNIERLMELNNVELSYLSVPQELPHSILSSTKLHIELVDRKITYAKNVNPKLEIHHSILSADSNTQYKEQLIDLAIQSGIYSRFHIDKRIGLAKFEELYSAWMINSLNRNIATDVLVYSNDKVLAGFVTLGEKNDRADIGIIAVDHHSRGKGIGKTLMTSAEKWCANLGFKSIQVVTQGDNIAACKLYDSCGYAVENVAYVYHIWTL